MEIDKEVRNARLDARQILATIVANISALAVGIILTMAASYKTMSNPMTPSYPIMLLTVTLLAIILGLFSSQLFCERCGRKRTLCLSAIPLIVCCSLIAFSHNVAFIMVAFSFGGLGSSICSSIIPIYVSEISPDNLRGALGSMRMVSMTIGFAIGSLIIHHWNIQGSAFIAILFTLIFLILMKWMPESPIFLVRKYRIDEATRSLMWLRDNDEQSVHNELSRIEQEVQKMPKIGLSIGGDELETIRYLLRDPVKHRGLIIASGLLTAQSMWEAMTMLKYRIGTYEIDCHCTSQVLPFDAIAISVVAPILGSISAAILIDRVGRRLLLLISCIGMSLQFIIDILLMEKSVPMWFSVALIFASMITYHLGMGTVPSVVAVEVFQRDVLSLGYMICLMISWIVLFIFIWIPTFVSNIYVSPIIHIVLSLCYFLFTYFLVSETRGETIELIINRLSNSYRSEKQESLPS